MSCVPAARGTSLLPHVLPGCLRTKLCARGQGRAVAGTRGRGETLLHFTASSSCSGTFKGTTTEQAVQAPPSPPLPSPPLAAALRRRLTPIVGLGLLGHTSLRVEARHRGSGGGVRVLQLARSIAAEVCLNIRARSERLTERCAAGSLCSPCCPVFGAPVHCTRLRPHTLPTCFS